MTAPKRTSDTTWMRRVREDLDSEASVWAAQTRPHGLSKLECIGAYLDIILTEFGYPGRVHDCPKCGERHIGPNP